MVSYSIEVLLITFHTVAYIYEYYFRKNQANATNTKFGHQWIGLLDAIRGTTPTLFTSAITLSYAMILAGLIIFVTRPDNDELRIQWIQGKDARSYDYQLVGVVSAFAASTIAVLHGLLHSSKMLLFQYIEPSYSIRSRIITICSCGNAFH